MIETLAQTVKEIETHLVNYEPKIESGYEKSGYGLKPDIKVEIKRKDQKNEITNYTGTLLLPDAENQKRKIHDKSRYKTTPNRRDVIV